MMILARSTLLAALVAGFLTAGVSSASAQARRDQVVGRDEGDHREAGRHVRGPGDGRYRRRLASLLDHPGSAAHRHAHHRSCRPAVRPRRQRRRADAARGLRSELRHRHRVLRGQRDVRGAREGGRRCARRQEEAAHRHVLPALQRPALPAAEDRVGGGRADHRRRARGASPAASTAAAAAGPVPGPAGSTTVAPPAASAAAPPRRWLPARTLPHPVHRRPPRVRRRCPPPRRPRPGRRARSIGRARSGRSCGWP